MKNKLFIAVLLFSFCSEVHLFAQEKSGLLEIFFPKSIAGSVTVREWGNDAETGRSKVITIDSATIVDGKYMYQYHKKAPTQVYLDVYPKDSLGFNQIFSFNPYSKDYLDCVVLDNGHAVVKTDSVFLKGYRGWQLRATIEGSSETDMFFKLLCDAYHPTKRYQFTDPTQGHVTNFDFIKKNPKSQFLLSKIYDDRTCYSTTNSIAMAFSLFDASAQDSEVGRKLSSYIHKQTLFSEKAVDAHTVDWLNLAGFPESNKKVADAFDIGLVPCYLVVDATGKVLLNALSGYGEIDGQNEYINVDKLNDYLEAVLNSLNTNHI